MDGTMAEIRCFTGNFAPKTWALCLGQLLNISTNQALFALLGTTYGGNGTTNFALPDLRGRIPVGTGTSTADGGNYTLGQVGGEPTHTLILDEMPIHNHAATVTASSASGTINYSVNGTGEAGTITNPSGALLAADDGSFSAQIYVAPSPSLVFKTLASDAVTISNLTPGTPSVTVASVGSTTAHSNIQPVLGMNYIICMYGVFPSRN
ncbi:Microcystin-dependent protein [Filimonas lacunae]|uniref:Microcystin-dependent protein n=1 Tax=Filimonas lacunae TaxID=477680 RepID=A0A173MA19_9BACT|nr:tail fiber protein [Filimonas lacunae]BAV04318.1 microcystin dependent protein [Filimonas lacunae]SIT31006.1 Microcystin-dependent protein [Filimonas lacunae]